MTGQGPAPHPFIGEGFDRQRATRFWDDIASWYSGAQQGSMVSEIVRHLHRTGVLGRDTTVLELGCGPGTYTLPMAPLVRSIVGLDTSQAMLDRLSRSVRENGIRNVSLVKADFMEYQPEGRSSTVVSSLCPGTGSIEGLQRMESWADHHCVHIMWIVNGWDDLHAEVWRAMGKDYSFGGRGSDLVERNLRSIGRRPEVTEFSVSVERSLPLDTAVSEIVRDFRPYGMGAEVEPAARRVLEPMAEGGEFRYSCLNRMRLVVWSV